MYRFFTALAAAFCLILPAQESPAASKVIRISASSTADPFTIGVEEFLKPWLEEHLKGYSIELYTDFALGAFPDLYQGAVFGSIQLFMGSSSQYAQFVPEMAVLDMPYILDEVDEAYQVCEGDFFDEFRSYCEKRGVRLMSLHFTSFRIFQFNRPVHTVADMKNIKFRTTTNKFHVKTINSFGMAATPMSPSEVLTALTQGVVQGVDGDIWSPINFRWVEGAKYVSLGNHMPLFYGWSASLPWWNSLPEEDRAILNEGFRLYYEHMKKTLAPFYPDEALKTLLGEEGCEVYVLPESEREILRKDSLSVYDELPKDLREIADRMRNTFSK